MPGRKVDVTRKPVFVHRPSPVYSVEVVHRWGTGFGDSTTYYVSRSATHVAVGGGKVEIELPFEVMQAIAEAVQTVNDRAAAEQHQVAE